MIRALLLLLFLAVAGGHADAQGIGGNCTGIGGNCIAQPVQQGGQVTSGHVPSWATNGVIQDGGTATAGLINSLGLYGNGNTPFCITSSPTAPPFAGTFWQHCLGVSSTAGGYVNLNGPTNLPWGVNINGTSVLSLTVAGGIGGNITNATALPTGEPYARTMGNRFADVVNVRDWGAVCDGAVHTLASAYPGLSLAQIQAIYPSAGVTSTSQKVDWAAIQQAIFVAGKAVYSPAGTCLLEKQGIAGLSSTGIYGDGIGLSVWKMDAGGSAATVRWGARSGFWFRDITIDATNNGSNAALSVQSATNWDLLNFEITNMQTYGVSFSNSSKGRIFRPRITKNTPASTLNFAITGSPAAGPNSDVTIEDVDLNGSNINIDGLDITVRGGTIQNWLYGAGVTTAQDTGNSGRYLISNILCKNSGSGTDANGFRPGCVENWGPYSVITGLRCFNLSGDCVGNGGQYSEISGNVGVDLNQSAGLSGACFDGRYYTSTYNGSFSTFSSNTCTNSAGTSGPVIYGYTDQASLTRVSLANNQFHNVKTAPVVVSGTQYSFVGDVLGGTASWTPGTINAGVTTSVQTMTVTGARLGDIVKIAFSVNPQGTIPIGVVSANDTISYWATNPTGGNITLGALTVTATSAKTINSADY